MAIDFSSLDATPAKTGKIDFTALGAIPAVGQDESTEDTSVLGAAGRGVVGMIPLGTQAYAATAGAAEGKPYLQERQELEKEIQADIASHPVARLAGQAAGIAAPALVTGGSSVPESLLGAAGQGAAIGAGFGAGSALDTLAGGGSGAKAAGEAALGAGLGAAGGAIGQKLGELAQGAIPKIEEFAARKASQSAGLGAEELGNMTPQEILDTGKFLMDKNIVKPGASTQEMFDAAKNLRENYGQEIGQIGNKARELGLSTDIKPLLDNLDSKYQAASALQNPDEVRNALFYKRGMADILTMARQNLPDTLADVQGAPVPNDITFDQLQRLKQSYGNSAFMNGTVKNPAAADVYSQLSNGQKAIIDTARNNPDLPDRLRDAMAGYSRMHPIVEGLQDVLGKERTGTMQPRAFGIVGKLAASLPGQQNPAINALTALGLVGAGHPLWGVGAFTATLNNPKVMATAAQSVASAIPSAASTLPAAGAQIASSNVPVQQNMGEIRPIRGASTASPISTAPTTINVDHPALAAWKPIFQKNAMSAKSAGEVQKANAVTDFVLSQRDPFYAAAKQKMTDEPMSTEPSSRPLSETNQNSTKMAEGGIVHEQPKSLIREALMEQIAPAYSSTNQKAAEPFNSDMADKLKMYFQSQKGK